MSGARRDPQRSRGPVRTAVRLLLVLGAYFASARLGILLSFDHTTVTPVWPPSGISVAAVLLLGRGVWPALTLGEFLANLTTGLSAGVSLGMAAGNTVEYLLAAYLLSRVAMRLSLDRIRDVAALVCLACIVSPLTAATTGTLSLWLGGAASTPDLPAVWVVWWLGDGLGILVCTSALLALCATPRGERLGPTSRLEAVLLLISVTGAACAVFLGGFDHTYIVYPLSMWAAVRLGQVGATWSALIISGIAVFGTVHGLGPFAGGSQVAALANLLLFIAALTVPAMVLAAAVIRGREAARMSALAATDALTGLPNRREFERVLALRRSTGYAVLAIDVDNLKVVNDSHGHEAGDTALRAVASALRMGLRDVDLVARTGGDEFAAYLPGAGGGDAAAAAERLRRAMHGIALARGRARVSIGVAAGAAGDDGLRCWAAADGALYRAKSLGRDRFELVGGGDDGPAAVTRMTRWETLLPRLISDDGMITVFQPIVDLAHGTVVGYEALGRPAGGGGENGVDELFAAADRLGMGRDLDWVCRRAALRGARGLPPGCPVFVNVSAGSLLDPVHGVDQMLLLLRWAHRRPEDVVLEITERDAVHDLARLGEVLAVYREHGFRFALDDVGEGHSTFEMLAAATPEFLKLAGSLVQRVDARGPRGAVDALVAFATTTGAEVIAEGLESAEAAATLLRLGVTLGQGYALGRPAASEVWRAAAASA